MATIHNQTKRKVSAVAQVEASWDRGEPIVLDVPTVTLYGDVVSITDMTPREKIMVWMKLLEEIEEQICTLELDSGLDRDDVVNVIGWRVEPIDPDEGFDVAG